MGSLKTAKSLKISLIELIPNENAVLDHTFLLSLKKQNPRNFFTDIFIDFSQSFLIAATFYKTRIDGY